MTDNDPKFVESPPILTSPEGKKELNTKDDWVEANKVVERNPPLSCSIWGVNLFIS